MLQQISKDRRIQLFGESNRDKDDPDAKSRIIGYCVTVEEEKDHLVRRNTWGHFLHAIDELHESEPLTQLAREMASESKDDPIFLRLVTEFYNRLRETTETELKFTKLADQWDKETSVLSSPTRKAMHPAYQQIIGMGDAAVPLILHRMKRRGGHWFWALSKITGENPIPHTAHGRVGAMREAWLKWGSKRGYC